MIRINTTLTLYRDDYVDDLDDDDEMTALEYAMTHNLPHTVDLLLKHNASMYFLSHQLFFVLGGGVQ